MKTKFMKKVEELCDKPQLVTLLSIMENGSTAEEAIEILKEQLNIKTLKVTAEELDDAFDEIERELQYDEMEKAMEKERKSYNDYDYDYEDDEGMDLKTMYGGEDDWEDNFADDIND